MQAFHIFLISPSPFWKPFPWSWSFILKMEAMLVQIPRVFPRVSCLGSAKAIQCPRPGPKIGDKSQQIPRYSPVCPRGHTPGMAADKCIMQSLSRIVTKRTKVPNFVYSFLGIWVSYLRWVPKKETSCYRIKREILFIIALLCLVTRLFLKIVFATVLSGKMAQNQCKDFPE